MKKKNFSSEYFLQAVSKNIGERGVPRKKVSILLRDGSKQDVL